MTRSSRDMFLCAAIAIQLFAGASCTAEDDLGTDASADGAASCTVGEHCGNDCLPEHCYTWGLRRVHVRQRLRLPAARSRMLAASRMR